MTDHEPIHSDPSYTREPGPADPAIVNQPDVITERTRLYTDWVLCQALQDTDWTFGAPQPEQMAQWLLSNPIWKAERESYSPRTKEQILKGIMQVLVDYQTRVVDGGTPVIANLNRKKADEKVKLKRTFRGIFVGIEFPTGSTRSGVAPDGTAWERKMVHDYGHITGIPAVDGDSLDCYLGPDESSDLVFIVPQWRTGGVFDEYKVLLGFQTADAALKGYLAHMPDGWANFGALRVMDMASFRKDWIQTPSYLQARVASAAPTKNFWVALHVYPGIWDDLSTGKLNCGIPSLSTQPCGLREGYVALRLPANTQGLTKVEDGSLLGMVQDGMRELLRATGLPSPAHQWAAMLSGGDADLDAAILTFLQGQTLPDTPSWDAFLRGAWEVTKAYNAQASEEALRIPGLRLDTLQHVTDYIESAGSKRGDADQWLVHGGSLQLPEGTDVTITVGGPWPDRATMLTHAKTLMSTHGGTSSALKALPPNSPDANLVQAVQHQAELQANPHLHVTLRPLPLSSRVAAAQWETPAFKSWFQGSKVVNSDGSPKVVYHGTTHVFDRFDPSKGDAEGFYGAALYFTDGRADVGKNYGTEEGPDLRNRIERRADELENQWENGEDAQAPEEDLRQKARDQARKELMGEHGGTVYLTYLRMLKPVVVQPSGGTRFEGGHFDPRDEDNWIEGRDIKRIYAALTKAMTDFSVWMPLKVVEGIMEALETYEGFTAYEFERAVRGHEALIDDIPGGPGPLLTRVYQLLGFDGVIMDAHAQFGKWMSVGGGTHHYIVWKPTQVKSALSNVGTFSRRSPRLVAAVNPRVSETPGGVTVSLGASEVEAQVVPERSQAIVKLLWVPPEMRSQGVGRLLMLALAGWCKEHDIRFLTGQDVSEHGESARIREHIPGKSMLFRRKDHETDPAGDEAFQEAPEGMRELLKGLTPDEGGKILVTRLAKHLQASIYDNYCPICGQAGCGGKCYPGRKSAAPIPVPSSLVSNLVDSLLAKLATSAEGASDEQWNGGHVPSQISINEAMGNASPRVVAESFDSRLLGGPKGYPEATVTLAVSGARSSSVPFVCNAWMLADPMAVLMVTTVLSRQEAMELAHGPTEGRLGVLFRDIRGSLVHELAHLVNAIRQGLGVFQGQSNHRGVPVATNHPLEVKAISTDLCDDYAQRLLQDPSLTVEEFLHEEDNWQWRQVCESMHAHGRHRIIRDLTSVREHVPTSHVRREASVRNDPARGDSPRGSQFNADLKVALGQTEHLASVDAEIGSGEHAATTDSSGQFWGDAGAGCVVRAATTGRILLSYRSEFVNEPHCWGVWGGAIDGNEDPKTSAARELQEETDYHGPMELREAYVYTNGDFRYTTFIAEVPEEFVPKLNWEAEGYEWFSIDGFPNDLHFGLKEALPAIKSKIEEDAKSVKPKLASAATLAAALAKLYRSDALYEALGEVGPFDGGCLICAEALILLEGRGSLVFIADATGRPEHYGAVIDGTYWDFAGPAPTAQAWIDQFCTQERIDTEGLHVQEGLGAPGEIPRNPSTSRTIADLLATALGRKTAGSSWVIPPKLAPYVQVQGGLDAVSQWHTKVWLGNSGTKDHTEVTFVAFDPATSTIVPIAASDEHRNGWDLIAALKLRGIIPALDWHILDIQLNFVDTRDPAEAKATVALFKAWRRLGGPNTTVRSRCYEPGFLLSMDDFIAAEGSPKDHHSLGTLAPAGSALIHALEALSAGYTRLHQGQRVSPRVLARAGQAALTAFKHVQYAYILSYAGLQRASAALSTMEEGKDTQSFEQAIFGFDGLKNQVHNALREYGKNQFKDRDLDETFGNCKLALEEFNRLGAAPPVKQASGKPVVGHVSSNVPPMGAIASKLASEPDPIDLPEIKWSMPTDAELLNEIRTEYSLEKLFIWATWPKDEDYVQAVQDLKRYSKPDRLDPLALEGRHLWRSYGDLKHTVTQFGGPKDPDSMVAAIEAGRPLPMPMVIRHTNGRLEVVGGNTRSGIAALAGQPITALVLDEAAATKGLAQRLIDDTKTRYAEFPDLFAAIEAYYLHKGPKPEITPEQGFAAYTLSADFGVIARLLGIDSDGQDLRLRPTLAEAIEAKTSSVRSSAKVASTWRKAADDLGLDGPALEDFYTIASKAMQGGDVKTFNAFLAKLQSGLGSELQPFLQALGGYTGLRPIWDAVVERDDDDLRQSLEDLRISPRLPSAKENPGGKPREVPLEDPHGEERLQPDLASMAADPSALEFNVDLMLQYPEFKGIRGGTPTEKAEKIIEHMTDNLLWLYEHWGPDQQARSKSWYVGGNRIVHRWAERFHIPPETVAGVLAALSPQQHWFQNVTLGERMLSALCEHADEPWDDAMTKVVLSRDWGSGGKALQEPEGEEELPEDEDSELVKVMPRSILGNLQGKTLNELDDGTPNGLYLMALWIRAYDEAHNTNGCRNVSPEGEFGDWYRTLDGKPVANRWQSFGAIMKAIQIFKNPDVRNISDLIGANHKVRSFYNNLIAPLSPGEDVTIDTHAVAAALLRPLSASSIPVAHNFGSGKPAVKPVRYRPAGFDRKGRPVKERKAVPGQPAIPGPTSSNITGITGLYGFYAEAYRRAAARVGIQPREMQSITWEAARGLFKPAQKRNKEFLTNADNLWENYSAGTTDKPTTQNSLLELAGGIDTPEWAVANPRNAEGERDSSYSGELPSPVSSGSGSAPSSGARTRTRTPGRAAAWVGRPVNAKLFHRKSIA